MPEEEIDEAVEKLIAGAMAPGEVEFDASLNEDRWYKGGRELASPSEQHLGVAGEQIGLQIAYEPPARDVHAASTKLRDDRIHDQGEGRCGPTGLAFDSAALEMSSRDFASAPRKMDALPTLGSRTLGSVGQCLLQYLLEVLPLRSQPTGEGKSRSLFPLPTSSEIFLEMNPDLCDDDVSWMSCLCLSLNSLWGDSVINEGRPNACQLRCLKHLMGLVMSFTGRGISLENLSWEDFLQVKSIDYRGDEVKVGRWFSWSNISPALPGEVGSVPLEEVCSLGCKRYVQFFDDYLKPPAEWPTVRAPRVMVNDSCWGEVCTGLVASGVCTWVEESELFHVNDAPLLNGLFGVSKEEHTTSGVEIFRLIMDLRPLNALCLPLAGDVNTLPSWSGMSPFFLQPGEQLVISSEDVKCFFYTMRVPHCWIKYLGFNKVFPPEVLPPHLAGKTIYIASTVLPMGFLNSVSLAQHVHRNLVQWSSGAQGSAEMNTPEQELRKDRGFTVANPSWRVYLDNYDLLERVEATEMVSTTGTVAPGVLALRQQYEQWAVPRNHKKAVERSFHCEMQGATVDGVRGVAYPREAMSDIAEPGHFKRGFTGDELAVQLHNIFKAMDVERLPLFQLLSDLGHSQQEAAAMEAHLLPLLPSSQDRLMMNPKHDKLFLVCPERLSAVRSTRAYGGPNYIKAESFGNSLTERNYRIWSQLRFGERIDHRLSAVRSTRAYGGPNYTKAEFFGILLTERNYATLVETTHWRANRSQARSTRHYEEMKEYKSWLAQVEDEAYAAGQPDPVPDNPPGLWDRHEGSNVERGSQIPDFKEWVTRISRKEHEKITLKPWPKCNDLDVWRSNVVQAVCVASGDPDTASWREWLAPAQVPKPDYTLLSDSGDYRFQSIDSKLSMALQNLVENAGEVAYDVKVQIRQRSQELGKKGNFIMGREIFAMILDHFRTTSRDEVLFNASHIYKLQYRGDKEMDKFLNAWLEIIANMKPEDIPSDVTLRDHLLRKIEGSTALHVDLVIFKGRENDDEKKTYKALLEIMRKHIARVREDKNMVARDKFATDYTNLGR
eukprot:s362_g23.t1